MVLRASRVPSQRAASSILLRVLRFGSLGTSTRLDGTPSCNMNVVFMAKYHLALKWYSCDHDFQTTAAEDKYFGFNVGKGQKLDRI